MATCVRCLSVAELACSRCEDHYCSLECQKVDWPTHRYLCFRMPTLKSAEKTTCVGVSSTSDIGRNDSSIIEQEHPARLKVVNQKTHVEQPEQKKTYCDVENKVQQKLESFAIEEKTPVLTPREAPRQKLEMFKNNQEVQETPKNFMKNLGTRQISTPAIPEPKVEEKKKILISNLNRVKWHSDAEKCKVILIGPVDDSDPTLLVLCGEKLADDHADITKKVQVYCKDKTKGEGYSPGRNEIVLALYSADKCWYRAWVMNKKNNEYEIQYIDYGNFDLVKPESIIPLPAELASPILVESFRISNISANFTQKQIEILQSGSFIINNIKQSGTEMKCDIFGA